MNRRKFLQTSAGLLLSTAMGHGAQLTNQKLRVGLIGSGWYGKLDLFRLIQVAPVEVVSLCDVDRQMLAEAVELVASRQPSKKKPRSYTDYRVMLQERDLDIVLVDTPDHWHALPTIAALQAGADVYVQKPISVDIVEGEAMVAAARKYQRVVQVGTQRRSTPHIVEARDAIIREGKLGTIGLVEICCYHRMRTSENPPPILPPASLDYEMWTGPAPMRPYNKLIHPRGWRAFTEYGNGVIGDMGIHMLDMVRYLLDLGWPKRIDSSGGILIDKGSISNIPDTQTALFDFENFSVAWQFRSWGPPVDPKYPWSATIYGDKGTLKVSVYSYDFIPLGNGQPVHRDVALELEQYPEDQTEKDIERHVAPAIRYHMQDFLKARTKKSRPVADIEEGHISTASCILANLSLQLGRSLRWDPAKQSVVDDVEANQLLRRPYRSPWIHPESGQV